VKEAEDKAEQWKSWYQGLCDEKEETLQAKMGLQTQLDTALAKQRCETRRAWGVLSFAHTCRQDQSDTSSDTFSSCLLSTPFDPLS